MSVSLPHLGVSVISCGTTLTLLTVDLACDGVTLHIGVTLPSSAASTGATFYLLQEDGLSRIILEDGSGFLQLESAP